METSPMLRTANSVLPDVRLKPYLLRLGGRFIHDCGVAFARLLAASILSDFSRQLPQAGFVQHQRYSPILPDCREPESI